jgi:branched-subunit amino acid ABC-type transport system permease component
MADCMQLLLNGLVAGSGLALVGGSLHLVRSCNGFFDLTLAGLFTVAAYVAYSISTVVWDGWWMPFGSVLAVCGSIAAAACVGYIIDSALFRRLRGRKASGGILLVAGWGGYQLIENLVALVFGQDTVSLMPATAPSVVPLLGARVTSVNLISFALACSAILASVLFMRGTRSLRFRCVASDPELAAVRGIPVDRVQSLAAVWAASLAALAGILQGMDSQLSPRMGFDSALNGIAALLIGQTHGLAGVVGAAFGLSILQQAVAWIFGSQWQNVSVFVLLLLALIIRGARQTGGATEGRLA